MPGAFVFPGGTISKGDYSMSWKSYLQQFTNLSIGNIAKEFQISSIAARAPMFTLNRPWDVPAEIAFRICAARELFEESGILIAINQSQISRIQQKIDRVSNFDGERNIVKVEEFNSKG